MPTPFGEIVAADARRVEFNHKNEVLVQHESEVAFVFVGDSITHMWELGAYFNTPNQLIVNRGISGDNTTYLLKRFEADVIQLHPACCVLGIGINDVCAFTPLRTEGVPAAPFSEVLSRAACNIACMAERCREEGIQLAIASLLPIDTYWLAEAQQRKDYVVALNDILKTLCHDNGYIYVDYYTAFFQNGEGDALNALLSDGLHPNVFGYDRMAAVLKETLHAHGIAL